MEQFKLPTGMNDFSPPVAEKMRCLGEEILTLFNKWGYEEVATPVLEYLKIFSQIEDKRFYKLIDTQNEILVLRPEWTTPIARLVGERAFPKNLPLRYSYFGPVLRYGDRQKGELNQFHQVGLELIGASGPRADAEIIALAVEALKKAGIKDFRLGIGESELSHNILAGCGLVDEDLKSAKTFISKKSLVDLENLLNQKSKDQNKRGKVLEIFSLTGKEEILKKVEDVAGKTPAFEELMEVYNYLLLLGMADYVFFDFSILRDFEYYTGIVFEGYASELGQPILGGGRYDELLSKFGLSLPSIGFALGLDRVLAVSDFRPKTEKPVLVYGKDYFQVLTTALKLQKKGYRVILDLEGLSVEQALYFAKNRGIQKIAGDSQIEE